MEKSGSIKREGSITTRVEPKEETKEPEIIYFTVKAR